MLYDIFVNRGYRNICKIIDLYVWQNRMKQVKYEIFDLMDWDDKKGYVCKTCGDLLCNWRDIAFVHNHKHNHNEIAPFIRLFNVYCIQCSHQSIHAGRIPKNY